MYLIVENYTATLSRVRNAYLYECGYQVAHSVHCRNKPIIVHSHVVCVNLSTKASSVAVPSFSPPHASVHWTRDDYTSLVLEGVQSLAAIVGLLSKDGHGYWHKHVAVPWDHSRPHHASWRKPHVSRLLDASSRHLSSTFSLVTLKNCSQSVKPE